jgi:metacaspase-1
MSKRALLVGINKYQNPDDDLRGCVNDVEQWRGVLIDLFGFAGDRIAVLTDRQATKAAMQHGLESLVTTARRGDVVLVHYSGHGTNVPDKSGDEADFRDEAICPTDVDWDDPLLDDWLRALFDRIAPGVNLTIVMDCCNSGSATRAPMVLDSREPISRYLPCPRDVVPAVSGRALTGSLRGARRALSRGGGPANVKDVNLPEILFTGCRDDQESADAFIADNYHGALTHSLVHAIRQAGGALTYRELHERAAAILSLEYSQDPQLEGRSASFDRRFLAPIA